MTRDLPSGPPSAGQKAIETKRREYGPEGLSEIARRAHVTRRWNLYLDEVRSYVETGRLDSEELDYKRAIERQLQEARRAVLEGDENCLDAVAKAISNNLTSTYDKTGLGNWFSEQPEKAREALRVLWTEDVELSTADRIRAFTPLIPDSLPSGKHAPPGGTGTRLRWIAVLLMARDARQFPPYKVTEFAETYERTGHPAPAPDGDEGSHYEHALEFLDEFVRRARASGLARPKDRLEAQSVLFAVAGGGRREPTEDRPCWFVGAAFGDDDQTDRFLRDGVWENGYDDKYLDQVRSIEPGDRIAIKSTYTKKHGLPFDNRGESTSTMAIKATGVVTQNMGDGRNLRVQWTPMEPHREWYFYTGRTTLWEVTPDSGALAWAAKALIDFTFNGTEQDYDRFLRHWFPKWYEAGPVPPPEHPEVPPLEAIVKRVQAAAGKRHLAFSRELIESLHLGLWANPQRHFAILAGLSGSGKTQLAMEYGRALTDADDESSVRLCAVSAAPGWHDPSPLLGYVNPLDGTYAGTDFQRFLLNAAGNPKEVHVCVLDEMNLSHPEQYLAPLLSAMEREGGMVEFHDSDETVLGLPQRIPYPRNLVLIGTVNMDETTMGISDKVLDRAFTLEFWDIEVDEWPGWETCALADTERNAVHKLLNALMAALRPARLHFGWRVIAEFVAFLERRAADSAEVAFERALDQITYAKVLPKLRGDDSQRYRTALEACRKVLDDEDLSKSAQKVEELMQDLDETGSFRFWR